MSKFALPQVGDIITVTTRYKEHVIGRGKWNDTTYENVCVAPSFGWTKPNEFCIPADGEPFITKRTISLNAVHKLVVHKVALRLTGEPRALPPGSGPMGVQGAAPARDPR